MDMSQVPGATQHGGNTDALPVYSEEKINGIGEMTVVEAFIPGVDRLLLDFDAGTPLPTVSLDTKVEPGSTAILGNGLPMVMLRGTTGVPPEDVKLRQLPPPVDPVALKAVQVVEKFDPKTDVIEVLFDPQDGDSPDISIRNFADQSGAAIYFNGRPILAVYGAAGLAPEDVVLVPRGASQI